MIRWSVFVEYKKVGKPRAMFGQANEILSPSEGGRKPMKEKHQWSVKCILIAAYM